MLVIKRKTVSHGKTSPVIYAVVIGQFQYYILCVLWFMDQTAYSI